MLLAVLSITWERQGDNEECWYVGAAVGVVYAETVDLSSARTVLLTMDWEQTSPELFADDRISGRIDRSVVTIGLNEGGGTSVSVQVSRSLDEEKYPEESREAEALLAAIRTVLEEELKMSAHGEVNRWMSKSCHD